MRRAVAAVIVCFSLAVGAQPALAHGGGGADNIVQVNNQSDGQLKSRARAALAHDPGPTVANQNLALARSSCVDCRTVAVAVQVVLIEGSVTDFRPLNAAVAYNEECVRCQTFAFARQEILSPGRPVELSDEAEGRIDAIQARMRALAASDEPFAQLAADLDGLTDQLVAVVEAEVARAGTSARHESKREVEEKER